jgi:hypothetical protein
MPGATSGNPGTLSQYDWAVAAFAAAASALILGLVLFARAYLLRTTQSPKEVMRGVLDTLLAAINPLDIFVRNLRNILWPALILVGVIGAATASRYTRFYLHLLSDKQTCGSQGVCPDLREFAPYLGNSLDAHTFAQQVVGVELFCLAVALLGGVGGTLAIVASARVQVLPRPMSGPLMKNWLTFLVRVADAAFLIFWLISLALSGFMAAFHLLNVTDRAPFPQPGIVTICSGAYLLARFFLALRHGGSLFGQDRPPWFFRGSGNRPPSSPSQPQSPSPAFGTTMPALRRGTSGESRGG